MDSGLFFVPPYWTGLPKTGGNVVTSALFSEKFVGFLRIDPGMVW